MTKDNRRKEISDFAIKLRALAESAPDGYAKRDLNRTIFNLRQRYVLTPEQKQSLILKLLADGLTTFDELLTETKFSKRQLRRDLEKLNDDSKIRIEKIQNPRGGAGRPVICYFPRMN